MMNSLTHMVGGAQNEWKLGDECATKGCIGALDMSEPFVHLKGHHFLIVEADVHHSWKICIDVFPLTHGSFSRSP